MRNQGGEGEGPDGQLPGGDRNQDAFNKAFMKALLEGQQALKDGEMEKAEALYAVAMGMCAMHARENPSARMGWQVAAAECMQRHDWPGALGFLLRVHQDAETRATAGLLCKSCLDLAELHLLMGDLDAADEQAREGIRLARETDLAPLVLMALTKEMMCAMARDDEERALAAADEAVGLECDAPGAETLQVLSLVNRARCRMELGNVSGAESDLDAVEELLFGQQWPAIMQGFTFKQADWWAVKARVRNTYGDSHGAMEACRQAIEGYHRVGGTWATVRAASMLGLLGSLLDEVGKEQEAREAKAEAERIRKEMRLPGWLERE